jgi:hypothetical protein
VGTRRPADTGRALFLLVLPGIWVGVVLALEVLLPARVQLAPLLAAAPAIACAGTGRRQCVWLAGLCAFVALLPWAPGNGSGGEVQRIGTFAAILTVVAASYVVAVRRQRMIGELTQVRAVAEVAQRVLLRPPRSAVGDVLVAARSASASAGASVGGDFYDIVDTPYGVRAIIGDVRGSGLGAVEVAAVLLGSFREAAYDEPDLRDLVRRLEISLRRFLGDAEAAAARVPLADGARLWETSNTLAVAPPRKASRTMEDVREEFASVAVVTIRPDGWLEHVSCGHAPPLLVRCGAVSTVQGQSVGLPLGLSTLAPGADDRARLVVTPFDSGDSLMLYTDGVTDSGGPDVEPLPLAGILEDLADAAPDYVLSAIEAEVTVRARGGRARDLAMLFVHQP